MAEEREFEVIDRRRVGREPPAEPPPGEAVAPEAAQLTASAADEGDTSADSPSSAGDTPESEDSGPDAEDDAGIRHPASTVDMVSMALQMLNEIAWVKLGLVPDPITGELGADLHEARLAIDCAGDLAHRLEGHVDGPTRRDLEVLVQNLKLNFVRRQTEQKNA